MGLRISTNLPSLSAQRILEKNSSSANKSMTRLASGDRITSAADDSAGLSISERLRGQIRSYKQAQRNANDGLSLVQVAEGSLAEISNNLIRMRELSVQAASDTVSDRERAFIDQEIQQLKIEQDRIAESTNFNGVNLLNGEGDELHFQVGVFAEESNRIIFSPEEFNVRTDNTEVDGVEVVDMDSALESLGTLDLALDKINGYRATLGAIQNRLNSTVNSLGITIESFTAANSRIRDTDVAAESAELIKNNILNTANVAVLAQANQQPSLALKLI